MLTEPQTVPRLSNKVLAVQRQKDACDEMCRDLTEGHQLNSAEASRALEENDEEYCRQAVDKKKSRKAELASSNIPAKSELFLHRQITINFDSGERLIFLSVSVSVYIWLTAPPPILSQENSCAQVGFPHSLSLYKTATYVDNSKKDNQHKYKHLEKEIYETFAPKNID